MKTFIILFIILIISFAFIKPGNSAEYGVDVPGVSFDTTKEKIRLNTVCINGYVFLVANTPMVFVAQGTSSSNVSVIQMWKQTRSTRGEVLNPEPMKCGE